jgi:hypothetical protein
MKKYRRNPHWWVRGTRLLSHPGCILSHTRDPVTILPAIRRVVEAQRLTVLVTHWWEYFRDGKPDEPFIHVLHETAEYLGSHPDISVTTFDAIGEHRLAALDDSHGALDQPRSCTPGVPGEVCHAPTVSSTQLRS